MHYLVVLDKRSVIGSIYANGHCDGFVMDGEVRHPYLTCADVISDNANYLHVRRMFGDGTDQLILIPHTSVGAIYHGPENDSRHFGFVPTSKPAP